MPRRRILLPYAEASHIFVVAEQFRNASKWMLLTRLKWIADIKMVPVTCSAFALELYLKCLLSLEHKHLNRSHELRKLFNQLDVATQNEIRTNVDFQMMITAVNVIHDAWRDGKQAGNAPDVNFDFLLDASSEAFDISRYIHEHGLPGGRGWVADPILEATRRTILARHPDWEGARQATPNVIIKPDHQKTLSTSRTRSAQKRRDK